MSKRPPDSDLYQQKIYSICPIVTLFRLALGFLAVGIIFVPAGVYLVQQADDYYQKTFYYETNKNDSPCRTNEQNQGSTCLVDFTFDEDVSGPILVYYSLKNYYQNSRRYFLSRDVNQLQGADVDSGALDSTCYPVLYAQTNPETILLNPCGLVANTYFTDVIKLSTNKTASGLTLSLDETNIALQSDRDNLFHQPDNFQSAPYPITGCNDIFPGVPNSDIKSWPASDPTHCYYYPDDETTQYLYETYPDHINPIEGVTNEHFIVWMRTAGLPNFRKLYGRIAGDVKAGDTISFNVTLNYEVHSFEGSKALILTTVSTWGGKNTFPGVMFVVVGSICFGLGVLYFLAGLYRKTMKRNT